MTSNNIKNRITLTGPPGIGKTTIVKSVCELLNQLGIPVYGFYTEEVRKDGNRIGFDVVDLNGTRGRLARSNNENGAVSQFKVGKYSVLVAEFEAVALPIFDKISNPSSVIVIDEVGKMEIFSEKFTKKVEQIFKNNNFIVLTTIPTNKGMPLVESIRNDKNGALFLIDNSNRDNMPQVMMDMITSLL